MRKRKILFKLLPIFITITLALGLIVFKTVSNPFENPTIKEEVENTSVVKRKIYLLSNDNLVVPVTVSFEKKVGLADELYYMVSLLKEDSNLNSSLKGVINKDASITELIIQDGVLTVGFSKEFLDYPVKSELRIVEAIVWTLSQYDEVKAVNINVDGKLLTKMPLGKTPLPKDMSKDIGINNHVFPSLLNAKRVVTYYTKLIDGEMMYVPISNNIEEDSLSVFFEASKKRTPFMYGLSVSKYINDLEILNLNEKENTIEIELTTSCLIEEDLVDYEVYEAFCVALSSYKEDYTVSILVEDEILPINGINEEVSQISNIIYNEIEL